MKLKHKALATLEKLINKLILLDQENLKNLKALEDKEICIEITNLNISVYAFCHSTNIQLSFEQIATPVAVKISSTSGNFLKILITKNFSNSISFQGVNISGDLDAAKNLQTLVANLSIDWEEQLSHFTGDIAARQIGNLFRDTKKKINSISNKLNDMVVDYIHHEAKFGPTKAEVEKFIKDVDKIHEDVERLESRINLLQKSL